jgi:hypothetical protein
MIAPVNTTPANLPTTQTNVSQQLSVSNKTIENVSNKQLSLTPVGSPDLAAAPSLKRKSVSHTALKLAQSLPAPSSTITPVTGDGGGLNLAQPEQKTPSIPAEQVNPAPQTEVKETPKTPEAKPADLAVPAVPTVKPDGKDVLQQSPPENFKQNSKDPQPQQAPTLSPPSEVLPPQQQQPLPSGPPAVEPGNYPNNTGPGAAYYNQNYIGPAVSFGRETSIGAASRFGLGRNISIRPSLFLGNSTRIAVPLTYDFGFNENEQFEKNPLVVFHAGGGLDYSTSSGSTSSGNRLSPLVVFGADVYLGDGASILLQIGNTFNSDFVAVAGVGLQF